MPEQDIVTRLLDFTNANWDRATHRYVLRKEAADEIRELRKRIDELERNAVPVALGDV